jgi:hypothetical protein
MKHKAIITRELMVIVESAIQSGREADVRTNANRKRVADSGYMQQFGHSRARMIRPGVETSDGKIYTQTRHGFLILQKESQ